MTRKLKIIGNTKFTNYLIKKTHLLLLMTGLVFLVACSSKVPGISDVKLDEIEATYGKDARERVISWRNMIADSQSESSNGRLTSVNDFFNQLEFVDDEFHWQQQDYWATPVETIASNGGDCEDFAIGKYFTLKELGISEQCLRLTYVKALSINKAHMVLTYYCQLGDSPLVLDNLNSQILPATERDDLIPVYSFNVEGLWIAKKRGYEQKVGEQDRFSLWTEFLRRMKKEKLNEGP